MFFIFFFLCYFVLFFLACRLFILALLTLIIFATFYEKTLIAKGFNLYDEKDNGNKKAPNKHHKHCENNNNEDNSNSNNSDKYEMNRINNNNNNNVSECEMNKMHVKNDLHNLGKLNEVLFFVCEFMWNTSCC